MIVELYERNAEEQRRGSKENRSFERLINGEKKQAADYCFGAEWLKWACDPSNDKFTKLQKDIAAQALGRRGVNRSIAIACAAIQLAAEAGDTDSCYFSDHGDVQVSMYDWLAKRSENHRGCVTNKCYQGKKCGLYSKDLMTNYGYTFKMILKILECIYNSRSDFGQLASFSIGGRAMFSYSAIYSWGYCGDENKASYIKRTNMLEKKLDLSPLKKALGAFAKNSSTLGNYGCIPDELPCIGLRGLNVIKGGVGASLFVYGKSALPYRVNDQFALFLEWLNENASAGDSYMVEQWKKDMLISHDGDLCDESNCGRQYPEVFYKLAAKSYKELFFEENPEGRIRKLVEYLQNVNKAIEARSALIVEAFEKES